MSFDHKKHKNSAVDDVIQYVLYLIKEERLPAGTKLPPENEICGVLSISRGPVREAMKIMQASGVIEIKQGSGTFIAGEQTEPLVNPLLLSLYNAAWGIDELVGLREMIDVLVYYTIIQNNDDETIERCTEINQRMTAAVKQGEDNERLHILDTEFHRELAKSVKNPLFRKIYDFAYELYESFVSRQFNHFEGTSMFNHNYHEQVLDALKNRDLNHAAKSMYDNMEWAKRCFEEMRQRKKDNA